MVIQQELTLQEKLEILSDAAKYDVACTSSGVERRGQQSAGQKGIGNTSLCGICHSFTPDGRCVSLLKILMTNECAFDCAYCLNRASNDVVRATFTPEEICTLTMEFYRRNYIEGLFLSSGVLKNPTYTMELMWQSIYKLRHEYHFYGYIHVKGIPGADPDIVEELGYLADRMSINLELPTADGLRKLAPAKTRKNILTPMRQIQQGIGRSSARFAELSGGSRLYLEESDKALSQSASLVTSPDSFAMPVRQQQQQLLSQDVQELYQPVTAPVVRERAKVGYTVNGRPSRFAPAGQSTQMIIGATNESDYHIMSVSEALYRNYDLKRVFYSAFIPVNTGDRRLPILAGGPPLLREHRLYQADWLLRFYGFETKELLDESHPNFNIYIDPKCDWALRHLELFPVEINRASYDMLLRVPGIGVKSAKRIIQARRSTALDFPQLKRIGVVLKRAHYFITCNGRMMMKVELQPEQITRQLMSVEQKKNWQVQNQKQTFRQMSLFEDFGMPEKQSEQAMFLQPTREDLFSAVSGQL